MSGQVRRELAEATAVRAMVSLAPGTLGLFSERAQKVLQRARRAPPPSRRTIARRLQAAGRPGFDAVLDFERRLGGICLTLGRPGSKQTFELGIEGHAPRLDPDEVDHPERTLVPIGSGWNGYEHLYMNELGEVIGYFDRVTMKSSSIVRYLEQLVMGLLPCWRGLSFAMTLRPALGARLATALGLDLVEEASDEYLAWWRGPDLHVQQVLFPGSWKAAETSVRARSLDAVARALEAAAAIEPALTAQVGSTSLEQKRLTKEQRSRAPTRESWVSTPGARRYRFGTEDAALTGVIWVLEGRGAPKIEQSRVYVDEDGEELFAWDTFTEAGAISRS